MEELSPEAIVDLPAHASSLLVGAPGSGKTTVLVQRLVSLVTQGVDANDVLILTPSRALATGLRDRVGLELGATTRGPRVRSVASLAFSLVHSAHRDRGLPAPDLLQASQIDADIQALLAGHREDGSGPPWPAPLSDTVRETATFRQELREWMARVTEHGLDKDHIDRLSKTHNRPEWAAASAFRQEFQAVVASSRPAAFDSAEILARALVVLEEGLPSDWKTLQHICVDDAHDVTAAGLSLMKALRLAGVGLTVASAPDVAGNTFRGSEPGGLNSLATEWGLTPVVMPTVYRYGTSVHECISTISSRIGTAGMGMQRKAVPGTHHSSEVFTLVAPGDQREANDITRLVQQARMVDRVPLDRIAVVTRRGQKVQSLVRELGQAGIPVRGSMSGVAVRDQPAARELLNIVALGRGVRPLTPQAAVELLTGRYGRMSHQDLRQLRFQMRIRHETIDEQSHNPYRPVDQLIAEALAVRGGFSFLEGAGVEKASVMAEVLDDIRLASATAPVTEVLWGILASSGVVETWYRQSLVPGPSQAGANRALDSVLALFQQAHDFVESQPGAALEVFLDALLEAEVPDDVVLPTPARPAVLVATPSGVAGMEFDVVIVQGVNDGVWPDLRLRGSLLAAHSLVAAGRGEPIDTLDERKIVQDDELRLCVLALSRATTRVIVTAVESEESQPSALFRMIQTHSTPLESRYDPPLSLPGTTGRLRRELVFHLQAGSDPAQSAHDLAVLAAWGARGSHPDSWWGLSPASSDTPLYAEGEVPISPSALQRLEESPVEWFLGTVARHDSSPERGLGSLIHQALERYPDGSPEKLWEVVDSKFGQLEYEAGWIESYHRRVAKGMVEALSEYLVDRQRAGFSLLASEQVFHLRHGRAVVTGFIDRIEQDDGGALIVVDLKTGTHSTDAKVVDNPQMLTYQLALETEELRDALSVTEAVSGGAALLFVKSGVKGKRYRMAVQEPISEETKASVLERIQKAVDVISRAEFSGEPLSFGPVGTPSKHRWHFIGQVCGDV